MNKGTFLKAVEQFHHKIIQSLVRKSVSRELVEDAYQDMVVWMLDNKSYTKYKGDNVDVQMYSWIRTKVFRNVVDALKHASVEQKHTVTILEVDSDEPLRQKTFSRDGYHEASSECPFCFIAELNHFGACGACGTILGQGKSAARAQFVTEHDLAEWTEIDLAIDVLSALDTLSPLERKLIERVAMGTESLEDMAEITDTSRQHIWRIYVVAKNKVREHLQQYAVQQDATSFGNRETTYEEGA